MALKRALSTQGAGTGTAPFTATITDANAGFSSDVKAMICSGTMTTTVNSNSGNGIFGTGVTANGPSGTRASNLSIYNSNGVTTTVTKANHSFTNSSTDYCMKYANQSFDFYVSAWDSAGVTITHPTNSQASQRYLSALLLGGDIEANVVQGSFSSNTSVDVSHGLSGAPEIILCFTNTPNTIPDNNTQWSLGWWANGVNVCSVAYAVDAEVLGTVTGAGRVSDAYIAIDPTSAGAVNNGFSVTTAGASTFTVTATVSSSIDLVFLVLRGTTSPIVAKAGIYTTPTTTGNADMSISLGVAPQVLMTVPSRATAVNTSYATDAASCIGLHMAANRSGTPATQQGGAYSTWDQGASTTDTESRTNNDHVLIIPLAGGGWDGSATLNAWNAADVQLNFDDAPSSAFKIPYLAFGVAADTPVITDADDELFFDGETSVTVTGTTFGASQGTGSVKISPTDNIADGAVVTQSVTSWADTSIQFTADRGTISFGATAYLFVTKDGGTANPSGYPVAFQTRGHQRRMMLGIG